MQALTESNEHLLKATNAQQEAGEKVDKVTEMYMESEIARTKAYQAIAYGLLAVADALAEGSG